MAKSKLEETSETSKPQETYGEFTRRVDEETKQKIEDDRKKYWEIVHGRNGRIDHIDPRSINHLLHLSTYDKPLPTAEDIRAHSPAHVSTNWDWINSQYTQLNEALKDRYTLFDNRPAAVAALELLKEPYAKAQALKSLSLGTNTEWHNSDFKTLVDRAINAGTTLLTQLIKYVEQPEPEPKTDPRPLEQDWSSFRSLVYHIMYRYKEGDRYGVTR
jgi:hypothetical protein